MSSKRIPMREAAKEWLQDPELRAEYQTLEAEFAVASALIAVHSQTGMTQDQVARAMGTTQAVIACLEADGSSPRPHPRALRQGHGNAAPHQLRAQPTAV